MVKSVPGHAVPITGGAAPVLKSINSWKYLYSPMGCIGAHPPSFNLPVPLCTPDYTHDGHYQS